MQVIPVIDLLGGQVVHARRGDRENYFPIETPLCPGSDPAEVAAALMKLHDFRALYIADIDAIAGRSDNSESFRAITRRFPGLALWIDRGIRDEMEINYLLSHPQVHAVIGTETQSSATLVERFRDHPRIVLSVDFVAGRYVGPDRVLQVPDLWPSRVIAMTLLRVGSDTGPDLDCLRFLVGRAGGRAVYAAGGIRDASDLDTLNGIGVSGALMATALHSGAVTAGDLERLA